jgi:hypothetical protein
MTVSAEEFIQRFLMHVLPSGFVRIRNFGFLANARRAVLLPLCRGLLHMPPQQDVGAVESTDRATWSCPLCHGTMLIIERLTPEQIQQSGRRCDYIDSSYAKTTESGPASRFCALSRKCACMVPHHP